MNVCFTLFFVSFLLPIFNFQSSDYVWNCADSGCLEPLSEGRILKSYSPDKKEKIHCRVGEVVKIFKKSKDGKHVYVKIGDREGVIPFKHVQEEKILNKAKIVKNENNLNTKQHQFTTDVHENSVPSTKDINESIQPKSDNGKTDSLNQINFSETEPRLDAIENDSEPNSKFLREASLGKIDSIIPSIEKIHAQSSFNIKDSTSTTLNNIFVHDNVEAADKAETTLEGSLGTTGTPPPIYSEKPIDQAGITAAGTLGANGHSALRNFPNIGEKSVDHAETDFLSAPNGTEPTEHITSENDKPTDQTDIIAGETLGKNETFVPRNISDASVNEVVTSSSDSIDQNKTFLASNVSYSVTQTVTSSGDSIDQNETSMALNISDASLYQTEKSLGDSIGTNETATIKNDSEKSVDHAEVDSKLVPNGIDTTSENDKPTYQTEITAGETFGSNETFVPTNIIDASVNKAETSPENSIGANESATIKKDGEKSVDHAEVDSSLVPSESDKSIIQTGIFEGDTLGNNESFMSTNISEALVNQSETISEESFATNKITTAIENNSENSFVDSDVESPSIHGTAPGYIADGIDKPIKQTGIAAGETEEPIESLNVINISDISVDQIENTIKETNVQIESLDDTNETGVTSNIKSGGHHPNLLNSAENMASVPENSITKDDSSTISEQAGINNIDIIQNNFQQFGFPPSQKPLSKEIDKQDSKSVLPESNADTKMPDSSSEENSPESDTVEYINPDQTSEKSLFSSVYLVMESIKSMFQSSDEEVYHQPSQFESIIQADKDESAPEAIPELSSDVPLGECTKDTSNAESSSSPIANEFIKDEEEEKESLFGSDNSCLSLRTTFCLIFTSIVILIFTLGHYYMESTRRDVELVSKNNDLASELFILQKERSVLEEQLSAVQEVVNKNYNETHKHFNDVELLLKEIKKLKEEKLLIEEREQEMTRKFAMIETNYNKLRTMLSDNKQKVERSSLFADIRKLKESSNAEILSLKEILDSKSGEIDSLTKQMKKMSEENERLGEKLNTVMNDEQLAIKHFHDSVAKLEQTIEESKATVIKLEDEKGKLKRDCESLLVEKELAESALQKAHGLKSTESLSDWLNTKDIRVSLLHSSKKIEELGLQLQKMDEENNILTVKENSLNQELRELNEKYEKSEKDKIEALTKVQVLSDYFSEKETQLQEELGMKEALWLQKESEDHTIYEQMRSLREENQSYKNQIETLRKEILDQESSYKKLIVTADEKADGYWVNLRQAERRLKETQVEAAQLRNRLTAIETSSVDHISPEDKLNKSLEVNGDMPFGAATSPPFMLYPADFIPPPPLINATPSRPPPLGRISSPPLVDFNPPPPLPPYELFLPPSPTQPPPSHFVHKPQPREGTSRKQKDSQSSNHSSESTVEKPSRRNKR